MGLLDNVEFLLQRIDSEEAALEYVRECSKLFYIFAAFWVLFGLFDRPYLVDAAIYGGLAFWLRRTRSPIPAVLMLAVSALRLWMLRGSIFLLWPMIVRSLTVILAIRTVEATLKLPRFRAPASPEPAQRANGAAPPVGGLDEIDRSGLLQLQQMGSDFSKPHAPGFFLLFPAAPAAEYAAQQVKALGYITEVKPDDLGREWQLRAEKTMVLNDEALKRARYQFEKIARAGRGRYSGWESAAVH
jgi:hypothetical protein